ncbi:MAG TPA: SAM-dependent methyltransferase [Acidimicrobiales bacterium]|nr:SAM-dependent methyltransferase [Acidimicrobiales bacterium]
MRESGPSLTAQRVAAHRLQFDRVTTPYGDASADMALTGDVAAGYAASQGRMHEYLRARTGFFDRVVVGAIEAGITQVVVGGAGYDGRSLRYAKPGTRWFELDHPATQADKLARLDHLGIDPVQVRFVAADFAEDAVAHRLTLAGLDTTRATLFLLEGVAVYLEADVLVGLLHQFRLVAGAGSRLAISVSVASGAGDAVTRARFYTTVAALGEPVRSTLALAEAEEVLDRSGWHLSTAKETGQQALTRTERRRSIGLLLAEM